MDKIEITQDNFYLGTKARFKGCKKPKREADFTSYGRSEDISSEYWYGADKYGKYVIRCSHHWSNSNNEQVYSCKKIKSCYWWIVTNCKNSYIYVDPYEYEQIMYCGKAYFLNFEKNILK